jgi:phosphatidylglycerophosphate synthase
MADSNSPSPGARLVTVPAGGATKAPAKVWGMTGRQRLERALSRARIPVRDPAAQNREPGPERGLLLIRDDFVFDETLIPALLRRPGVLLTAVDPSGASIIAVAAHLASAEDPHQVAAVEAALIAGAPGDGQSAPAGLQPMDAAGLASAYNQGLRKRAPPYLIRLGALPAIVIERRMFDGAYKGVTDFVTKRLFPWPAFHATRFCARFRISPNLVTLVSLVLVLLAMDLFWRGAFGIGLVAAWGMCFLDTVDGKLARVTLRSSRFGNIFDHGIDLIHPPFWYYAWYHGLIVTTFEGADTLAFLALLLSILGYVGGRLQEGLFVALYGIQIHIWRPVDSWFREITARRNPNLAILTLAALAGHPREGLLLMAGWTAVSFIFHTIRIVQASVGSALGRAPVSWLAEPIARAA